METILEAAMEAYFRAYLAISCLILVLKTMREEF